MNTPKTTAPCLLMPVILSLLFMQTTACGPYAEIIYFFDPSAIIYVFDPSENLEQCPLTIREGIETQALALAHCDWKETLTTHIITLDVPGLSKDRVMIELEENNVLRISGERKTEVERVVKFSLEFQMPKNSNVEALEQHLKNGALTIKVPKKVGMTHKSNEINKKKRQIPNKDGNGGGEGKKSKLLCRSDAISMGFGY